MTTLQFADTHNLVAFLAKPAESEGFEQVVGFLNASSIRYALTINPTIYTSCIEQFWSSVKVKMVNGEHQLQALVDRKNIIITEATVRGDLQLEDADRIDCLPNATIFEQLTLIGPRKPKRKDNEIPQSSVPVENVADEAVYKERDASLERATTNATCLDAEQDIGNISKTQFKATPNEPSSIGTSLGGGPRHQDTMRIPLLRLGDKEDASKQGRKIHDIDADEDITLENVHDADMFGVHNLDGDEVFVETEEPMVNAATTTSTIIVSVAKDLFDADITLAQALAELKSTKPKAVTTAATTITTAVTRPKAKDLVIQEHEQAFTPIISSKDKGKGIMVKEPLKMKKKNQVLLVLLFHCWDLLI
ncbi:hypothetical protein Tco_1464959 [Tanacetum coccineum]